jgi:hypothetical protein
VIELTHTARALVEVESTLLFAVDIVVMTLGNF